MQEVQKTTTTTQETTKPANTKPRYIEIQCDMMEMQEKELAAVISVSRLDLDNLNKSKEAFLSDINQRISERKAKLDSALQIRTLRLQGVYPGYHIVVADKDSHVFSRDKTVFVDKDRLMWKVDHTGEITN